MSWAWTIPKTLPKQELFLPPKTSYVADGGADLPPAQGRPGAAQEAGGALPVAHGGVEPGAGVLAAQGDGLAIVQPGEVLPGRAGQNRTGQQPAGVEGGTGPRAAVRGRPPGPGVVGRGRPPDSSRRRGRAPPGAQPGQKERRPLSPPAMRRLPFLW